MPYNNYFPVTYNPIGQATNTPQIANQSLTQAPANGIIWVQGHEGAKAYPVTAGSSVVLMDSEDMVFYIKSTDMSGMPQPLRVYEYKERVPKEEVVDDSIYVTHEELEKRLSALEKPKRKMKKEEDEDE